METIIISLICIVLIVVGGMTMSQSYFSSIDKTAISLEEVGQRDDEIQRTNIAILQVTQAAPGSAEISISNIGQKKLSGFADWDIILQYFDAVNNYYVKWLPYNSRGLDMNEWTVKGIYMDAATETPEVFEVGVLNPGEQIKLSIKLDPAIGAGTTNLALVSTPNGVSAQSIFSGYTP
ncbi:MAG: hypothetical protein PHE50_09545 [Dehalococcoidales bacterium]|nr:hypothetical protein [Dehalococcoidales bacterium]